MMCRSAAALLLLLCPAASAPAQVDPTIGSPLSLAEAEQRAFESNPR